MLEFYSLFLCLCLFVSQKEKNDDLDYHIMLKLVAMKEDNY